MSEEKNIDKEELNDVEENLEEAQVNEDLEFEGVKEEADEASSEFLQKRIKKLEEENKKLSNEVSAYQDKLTRLQAEFQNYKTRTAKEKEGIFTDATLEVLKEMLPVLDNLERAATVDGSIEDIKKGIDMTVKQFQNALVKLNVEEIPTSEGFDPNHHEAVMHIQDDNYGENEITEVFLKGYKRGDKVLRHSMVKVAN
ncbi:GrpE protein [Clostridium cellulovorans 743B]|uniref:Protein GrpE n=2 Tax=Clostridium cellulovorans TaxID=1493 RepID=D9SW24_CLOC7|nr:GrpE protein [Clostridium cellulovorans 743B]